MKYSDFKKSLKNLPKTHVISPVILGMLVFAIMYIRLLSNNSNIEGIEYFENGEYEKAMNAFNEYLTLEPHDTKTLYNRGRCYEILGNREAAIKDYNDVIDRDPDNINALISCTQALYKSEKYESAVNVGSYAILVGQDNYLAHYYNARANHKYGDLGQALTSYNKAIDINPDFGLAYMQRGSLLISLGWPPFGCHDLRVATNLNVEGAKEALDKYCGR